MPEFSHLHCHTQFSLLDGAARIDQLVKRAADLDIPAVAITDHGNLFGVPEFNYAAKNAGIKPIIGCEFYLAPGARTDKSDRTRYHQLLLAKNQQGYKNLIKLSSLSYTEGFYYKPRVDLDLLERYSEGIVATTCCLQGMVPQMILKKGEEEALKAFNLFREIFGDDYYIELQDHGIDDQKRLNDTLIQWSEKYNCPSIISNDVHYVKQSDAAAQDVLLCLQTGKEMSDPNRMKFENDQFFLKTTDELRLAFDGTDKSVIDRSFETTLEIADKCDITLTTGELLLPQFPIPEGFNNNMDVYLRYLVFEKAKVRYPERSTQVQERLDFELKVIKEMGYAGYFLIVQDFTTAARNLDVRVGPGRGSAAGSAVAYCLGITNIDPLEYDLLFERFLNPERNSMPDIDIDFDDRGRGKVIDYVVDKYGRANVCQIITYGTMGARSVIRDVARVLGIDRMEADRIAKLIPEGPSENLSSAREKVKEFRELYNSADNMIRSMMQYSDVLEGSARHTGIHAAGVIIAPGDVSDYVPVAIQKSKNEEALITQYDGKWIEKFGLLKMDFLGLKTLTILNDAVEMIAANHGVKIDIEDLNLEDDKTFELFQQGRTVGIFQFESSGMRDWLCKLKPTSINDLIAMNALYRPGPMELIPNYVARKHGLEEVDSFHPILSEILEPTFGLPIYQEQVMQMAQVMAGYSLGQADLLRRAMGKKKKEEMDKQRSTFVEGAKKNDVSEKEANAIFDVMAKFAGYGFNKSHSAAYSVVAYQTAYLKANYPAEFMAAVLTSDMSDSKKVAHLLDECRALGIEVIRPEINHSVALFTVKESKIRFGLEAIKGVGRSVIDSIVEERESSGPFDDLFDFTKRLDHKSVNKKAIENLLKAGTFDKLSENRAQLVGALEDAVKFGHMHQANVAAGQNSLFGDTGGGAIEMQPVLPNIKAYSKTEKLRFERELMGFYVSGHPLDFYGPEVRGFATRSLASDDPLVPGATHRFCGIITEVKKRTDRRGREMAYASIEDFVGHGELTIFSRAMEAALPYLNVDELVLVNGVPEDRGGQLSIRVNKITPLRLVRDNMIESLIVRVTHQNIERVNVESLIDLCGENRGNSKLYFDLSSIGSNLALQHSRSFVIDPSPDLMKGLFEMFGVDNVSVSGNVH